MRCSPGAAVEYPSELKEAFDFLIAQKILSVVSERRQTECILNIDMLDPKAINHHHRDAVDKIAKYSHLGVFFSITGRFKQGRIQAYVARLPPLSHRVSKLFLRPSLERKSISAKELFLIRDLFQNLFTLVLELDVEGIQKNSTGLARTMGDWKLKNFTWCGAINANNYPYFVKLLENFNSLNFLDLEGAKIAEDCKVKVLAAIQGVKYLNTLNVAGLDFRCGPREFFYKDRPRMAYVKLDHEGYRVFPKNANPSLFAQTDQTNKRLRESQAQDPEESAPKKLKSSAPDDLQIGAARLLTLKMTNPLDSDVFGCARWLLDLKASSALTQEFSASSESELESELDSYSESESESELESPSLPRSRIFYGNSQKDMKDYAKEAGFEYVGAVDIRSKIGVVQMGALGYGVIATQNIQPGEVLCEYRGEYEDEPEKTDPQYVEFQSPKNREYRLCTLYEEEVKEKKKRVRYVNARRRGNEGRAINCSSEEIGWPNARFTYKTEGGERRMQVMAVRFIKQGDAILVPYQADYFAKANFKVVPLAPWNTQYSLQDLYKQNEKYYKEVGLQAEHRAKFGFQKASRIFVPKILFDEDKPRIEQQATLPILELDQGMRVLRFQQNVSVLMWASYFGRDVLVQKLVSKYSVANHCSLNGRDSFSYAMLGNADDATACVILRIFMAQENNLYDNPSYIDSKKHPNAHGLFELVMHREDRNACLALLYGEEAEQCPALADDSDSDTDFTCRR